MAETSGHKLALQMAVLEEKMSTRQAETESALDRLQADLADWKTDWLEDALNELLDCPACAQEDDIDEPAAVAMAKAESLLRKLSSLVADRPDVYPMQERCIAIDFRNPDISGAVLFVIEEDGSGSLYRRTPRSRGRLRVDDAKNLLKEGGIMELERVGLGVKVFREERN